tara:strand:- start:1128 stop:2405 length:1278 start_codon:yes stop_codon:yes gene_type:complete
MASTYTNNLGVEKIGSGEQAGAWGTTTNLNFDIIDRAVNGVYSLGLTGTTTTLTTTDGALSDGGYKVLILTGNLAANNTVTISPNDQSKVFLVFNNTGDAGSDGPYSVIFTQGSGADATVANGETAWIYADGGDSSAIVRKVTFNTELSSDTSPQLGGNLDVNGKLIKLGDSATAGTDDTIELGASDDMQLYHDGTNSFIANKTGALKIATETSGIAVTIGHTTSETTVADNLTVTGNAEITGTLTQGSTAVKVAGKETIWVPATAMYPNTTNGCAALAQAELANGPEIKVLDFDASSDENAQFSVAFPKSWNEGTITFQAFFTVTGTNTGTVAWGLSGVAIADDDSCNTAFGTNVVATAKAHSGTSNDLNVSAESGSVTIAGSPSTDELVFFQIMRDVSADSQTGDARLLGIKLFFTTDAKNDS